MKSVRILHVGAFYDLGGIETWLMDVLRRTDRNGYKFDFLTHTSESSGFDEEIKSLGSKLISCAPPHRLWRFIPNFYRILKENGPYDAVHCHAHHFNGIYVLLAFFFRSAVADFTQP